MQDYADVEAMLFTGFLTSEVEVGGVPLVLKTLNQLEHRQLDLRSFSITDEWKDGASYFLAYSTLFFNHINILHDREAHLSVLADHYRQLPDSVLTTLLKITAHLNRKSGEALKQVQGYSCGPTSRQMWQMHKGTPLCDTRVTGFEGTAKLGLNMHQRMWSYFHTMEDEEEDYLRQYGLAKFITSPHASKDIKRIDAKDQKKIHTRDQRRQALYEGENFVDKEANQILVTKDSAEELMGQMEHELRGEKDYHDLIIEQHRAKIRNAYLRREEEAQRRQQEAREMRLRREVEEAHRELSLEGFSPEEIAHYLQKADQRRNLQRLEKPKNYKSLEEKEERLLRWGFLDEDDIPDDRRHFYSKKPKSEEDFENPLIKEHYERVSNDLKERRVSPQRDDDGEL